MSYYEALLVCDCSKIGPKEYDWNSNYTAERLLSHGAETENVDDAGMNCLHYASVSGNLRLMRHFVEKEKMDVNAEDRYGDTPLFKTVMSKNSEASIYLLSVGSDIAHVSQASSFTCSAAGQ